MNKIIKKREKNINYLKTSIQKNIEAKEIVLKMKEEFSKKIISRGIKNGKRS